MTKNIYRNNCNIAHMLYNDTARIGDEEILDALADLFQDKDFFFEEVQLSVLIGDRNDQSILVQFFDVGTNQHLSTYLIKYMNGQLIADRRDVVAPVHHITSQMMRRLFTRLYTAEKKLLVELFIDADQDIMKVTNLVRSALNKAGITNYRVVIETDKDAYGKSEDAETRSTFTDFIQNLERK